MASEDNTCDKTDPERKLDIAMVGDILLHSRVEDAARDNGENYDFGFIFDELRDDISGKDLAIANQEVILGGEELKVTGYPSFNAPYEIGDALADAGFDVICHATNHALDRGKKGIENSLSYWKHSHPEILIVGINGTERQYDKVDIVELDGIKIAILNYTYGTNGIPMPADMPHAVDVLDGEKVVSDLKYAEEMADFTIVCTHWGTEYSKETDGFQKKWCSILRSNGADLVLGTHPHVIEPVCMYEDEVKGITNNHGDGDMLVYYSLGNFVNWTSGRGKGIADRVLGGMAEITIGEDDNGEIAVLDYSVKPLVCHLKKGSKNISVYPLSEYTDAMGKENEIRIQDPGFSKEYCVNTCNEVWGILWK
ncbi:MAG: CapA family protein [Lachnospiraceae bacterium]|nr:CapA family protein [Lachnospiraceae bacterium]